MNLAFLKNITLKPNTAVKTTATRAASVEKNPTEADIRIFKTGAAYPSLALIASVGLQYMPKASEDKGFGFDIFSSKDFPNTAHLVEAVLFIARVPRSEGKVDLFASTTYNEDGTPAADVATQGSATFGKTLLETLKAVYGVEPGDKGYIDLTIVTESPFTTDNNLYYVPKVVSRGEKKGEVSIVVRKDTNLYALVPTSIVNGEGTPVEENPIQDEDTAGLPPVPAGTHPSLSEIEAESDGTVEKPMALPEDVLDDTTEESFSLEDDLDIQDAEGFDVSDDEEEPLV